MKAIQVGNGYIGTAHRNAYKRLKDENKDIELVAVCDIREEKLKETNGAKAYTDYEEMLASEKGNTDYVDICVPTYLHCEFAVKAMKAGYNVLCEKPMALTEDETKLMLDTSKETGKKLMIAQCCRFMDEMEYIKEFIEAGTFGKVIGAEFAACGGTFPTWGYENWFLDGKKSGGVILDVQAHNLDLMNWFLGMPKSVSAVAFERGNATGYATVSANHIYEDFFVYSYCDWSQKSIHNPRVRRINFENGYIYFNKSFTPYFGMVDKDGKLTDLTDKVTPGYSDMAKEIEYFNDCIKNDKYPEKCPPEESARVVTIMRAQEKSADNMGMPIKLA